MKMQGKGSKESITLWNSHIFDPSKVCNQTRTQLKIIQRLSTLHAQETEPYEYYNILVCFHQPVIDGDKSSYRPLRAKRTSNINGAI